MWPSLWKLDGIWFLSVALQNTWHLKWWKSSWRRPHSMTRGVICGAWGWSCTSCSVVTPLLWATVAQTVAGTEEKSAGFARWVCMSWVCGECRVLPWALVQNLLQRQQWGAVPDAARWLGGWAVTEKWGWQWRSWVIPVSKGRLGNCLCFLLLWDLLRASPHPLPHSGILPCSVVLDLVYGSDCNSSDKSWALGELPCKAWIYFLRMEYSGCPLRGGGSVFSSVLCPS